MSYLAKQCESAGVELNAAALTHLESYMQMLAMWNKVHNLTAIVNPQQQVDWLLLPSLLIHPHIQNYQKLIDLGTGGGFPGLALAIVDSSKQWELVEKSPKKCAFLRHVLQKLGLKNVKVHNKDFNQMAVDKSVDVIITRGSCKLPMQLQITKPWREQGLPLFSIQSVESIQSFSLHKAIMQHNLSYVQQDKPLKLLIIPPGVDLE